MTKGTTERLRRFTRRHIGNHWVMIVCFIGLVVTGMPQRYASQAWAKGVVMIVGGVERVRWLHHLLGSIMALQLVWHFLEAIWLHYVRRLPMPMVPRLKDVTDFRDQVRFNLGVADQPPEMGRYTFAEKLEYLALVWGSIVMVATGLLLLYPVRWSSLVPGEFILAAKAAHGGEALLAFLSILTWHFYFVHVRHWNTAIFTGHLDEHAYAEEHALELARLRRGEAVTPQPARIVRVVLFALAVILTVGAVIALMTWLGTSSAAIKTIAWAAGGG
jgi:cytochrome b subunit of formate dehydrogenase